MRRLRKTLDRLLELWAQEPPGPAELAPGEDPAARVFLDRVGLEFQQPGDVVDRQHILARDAHVPAACDDAERERRVPDEGDIGVSWRQGGMDLP
jgi:hypothetical protein